MFHPQVLLDKVHSCRLEIILVCVIVVAVQAVHDVTLKVIKQVHLLREFFGGGVRGVILANVHRPMSPRSDIIEMAIALSGNAQVH